MALRKLPERQRAVLIGLETFTRGEDGWRAAGTVLLAEAAGLSVTTLDKARRELVASGLIDYRRGDGRGHVSTYRIKVPNIADHLYGPAKVPKDDEHLSKTERYPNEDQKGTQTGLRKGTQAKRAYQQQRIWCS
jgi:hypothetical protein